MRRAKRKPRPPLRPVGGTRRGSSTPTLTYTAVRRFGVIVLWAGSLTGIAYGLHRLEPYAREANGDRPWDLEWVDVPTAVDDWILGEIERDGAGCNLMPIRNLDIHTPDLCRRLADELAKSPWVEEVQRVAKRSDGTVSVRARFREYLTFVLKNDVGHLVNGAGVRLPRVQRRSLLEHSQSDYGMVYLEGVRGAVPDYGQPWDGDDVAGGLKLVAFLHEHCPRGLLSFLRAVDVSNYKDRLNRRDGWLRIRTIRPDQHILWGLPPGEEYDIEAPAKRKLEMLWSHYSEHAQLPDRDRIDVRDEDSILVQQTP